MKENKGFVAVTLYMILFLVICYTAQIERLGGLEAYKDLIRIHYIDSDCEISYSVEDNQIITEKDYGIVTVQQSPDSIKYGYIKIRLNRDKMEPDRVYIATFNRQLLYSVNLNNFEDYVIFPMQKYNNPIIILSASEEDYEEFDNGTSDLAVIDGFNTLQANYPSKLEANFNIKAYTKYYKHADNLLGKNAKVYWEDDSELTRVSKQFYEENMPDCNYDKLEYLKRCYETFRRYGSAGFDFQYHKRNYLETIYQGEILDEYSGVCYDYSMLLCVILRESGMSCSFNIGDAFVENIKENENGRYKVVDNKVYKLDADGNIGTAISHAWNTVVIDNKSYIVDLTNNHFYDLSIKEDREAYEKNYYLSYSF